MKALRFFTLSIFIAVATSAQLVSAAENNAVQITSSRAEGASEANGVPSPSPAKLEPLFALVNDNVQGRDASGNGCYFGATRRTLPARAMVVMARAVVCKERYQSEQEFIEVLYDGKSYYLNETDITTLPDRILSLAKRSQADVEFNWSEWVLESKNMTMAEKSAVFDKLNKSKNQGVAVVSAGVFDVSEYTEGTGFRIKIYNSGKKTIKYITIMVRGLNAVGDPVTNRFNRSANMVFRGIGPIESGDTASYSKEYMWMTDIVESFDIPTIKLEFMDGTSRTIASKQLTKLTRQEYATILGDSD